MPKVGQVWLGKMPTRWRCRNIVNSIFSREGATGFLFNMDNMLGLDAWYLHGVMFKECVTLGSKIFRDDVWKLQRFTTLVRHWFRNMRQNRFPFLLYVNGCKVQRRRKLPNLRWARSTMMGPLVGKGLPNLLKSGWVIAHPAHCTLKSRVNESFWLADSHMSDSYF